MNEILEELMIKYGSDININKKSPKELLDEISIRYAVSTTSPNNANLLKLKNRFISHFKHTHHAKAGKTLNIDNISFVEFHMDNQNEELYKCRFDEWNEGKIYLIVEQDNGYFETNSRILSTKIVEFLGVSENDIRERNIRLHNYLLNREQLDSNYEKITGRLKSQ